MRISFDFGDCQLAASLHDCGPARALYAALPREIELTTWGDEAYGELGIDLGGDDPVPTIPPGGIAWSQRGGYLCFFYGQTPAWPVDHIGDMDAGWEQLRELSPHRVKIIVADRTGDTP